MLQEDLENLLGIVRRMGPRANISINNAFSCSASELAWVLEEALIAREQAKIAGTYEPYKSIYD